MERVKRVVDKVVDEQKQGWFSRMLPSFSWFKGDRALWIVVVALAITSVLVVYSSTAKMAYDSDAIRTTTSFLRSQLILLAFASCVILVVHRINMSFVEKYSLWFYLIALALTVAATLLVVQRMERRVG